MMQGFMGNRKHNKYQRKPKNNHQSKHSKKCGALCCGSRISTSSSTDDTRSSEAEQFHSVSNLAHALVQARLEQMINERDPRNNGWRWRRREIKSAGESRSSRCIILIAMEKSSYDPREDFRESMMEVITSKGLEEPKELRSLLNCYTSMNPREHRQTILEAFHEVCITLFSSS